MGIFQSMGITSSALTAQRLRLDIISSNIANADTTRGTLVDGKWTPYKRKMVSLQTKEDGFSSYLNSAMGSSSSTKVGNGVKVAKITEDNSEFQMVYDPEHPDADPETGYVAMPNVDPLQEMTDLISASRSYEANVTVFNASKAMLMKALEIGK